MSLRQGKVPTLGRDEAGAAAVMVALAATALVGFAALAADVGLWYADLRSEQGAADAAAYSAAVEYASSASIQDSERVAYAVAAQGGMTAGSAGVAVVVNMPPTTGSHAGVAGAVEVIITKSEGLFFSAPFLPAAGATARAVAMAVAGSGNYCVLALDTSAETALTDNGSVTINVSSCGLYVNAGGPNAMISNGSSFTLDATDLSVVGGVSSTGHPTVNITGAKNVGTATALADPYAATPVPAAGACAAGPVMGVFSPGTYCSGISLSGGTYTLSPGVYVFPPGQSFTLSGNPVVNGTGGVTIILQGDSTSAASINVGGTSTLNVTAPTSGTYAGVAIFQDPAAPASVAVQNSFGGTATVNVTGVIDFSKQDVSFAGIPSTSTCTQLIAWKITFSGSATLKDSCGAAGTKPIGGPGAIQLVE